MKFFKGILCVLILVSTIMGCGSDPKATKIPHNLDSWEENEEIQGAVEKLTEEEKRLFASYVLRTAMSEVLGEEGIKAGMTIGDAIESERTWEKEQAREEAKRKELAKKIEKERVANLRKMNEAVTVSLLSINFRESDYSSNRYSDDFVLRIGFKNHTEKKIIGIKGITVFKDVFGDIIKKVRLSNDDDINAGESYVWIGTLDYNQFMAEDKKLRTTPFEKIKFEWEPLVYLFADGTEMQMPTLDE